VAALLQADEGRGARPWDRYITQAIGELGKMGKRWDRPPTETDRLNEFRATRPKDYLVRFARALGISPTLAAYHPINHPRDLDRIDGVPRIFIGVIASANNLQKNPARRDDLRSRFRAMAVEMEGSGVADAAYQLEQRFFVVRGTCDYCNSDKNDDWHYYAAIIAAAYTRALLEAAPLLPYLDGSAGGAVAGSIDAENVQNLMATVVSGRTADEAGHSKAVENAVQRHLEHALTGVLEDQARARISAIKSALDAWESQEAIKSGEDLSAWIAQHTEQLSSELVIEVYELLARIEIIKATRNRDDGGLPDLRRAEDFLARAKHVAGR